MFKSLFCSVTIVAMFMASGCATLNKQALRESLLESDKQWSVVAAGDDIERVVEYWTDNAVVYTAGRLPIAGKDALRAFVRKNRSIPGFSLTWEPTEAIVSRTGDLGFTLGPYTLTVPGQEGKLVTQRGHYICVWKREGKNWRCSHEVHAPLPPLDTSTP